MYLFIPLFLTKTLTRRTATEQVGGNQQALLERLKLMIARQPILLRHGGVDRDDGEAFRIQHFAQGQTTGHGIREDNPKGCKEDRKKYIRCQKSNATD